MKRRIIRSTLVLVALVGFGILAAACSDDSGSVTGTGDGSATPADGVDTDSDGVDSGEDPAFEPVSDEEFDEQMSTLRSQIESAGDDVCALSAALGILPPDPTNAEQTKQYADAYVLMLHNIAKILGPETERGAPIEDAANKFAARVAELEYSPIFVEDGVLSEIMNNEAVSLGLVEFGQRAAECPEATG